MQLITCSEQRLACSSQLQKHHIEYQHACIAGWKTSESTSISPKMTWQHKPTQKIIQKTIQRDIYLSTSQA